MSDEPKPAPPHPHRPYVVRIFGRSFRVHATTPEAATRKALSMVIDDDHDVRLDDGKWGADACDSGPSGFLLPDPYFEPGIWYDLGKFGKWATDGRSAFHESLAWRVERHSKAWAWTPTGRVDSRNPDPTAELTSMLSGSWEPTSLRLSDLTTSGVGPIVEGPGDLGIDQKLYQPFARDEWLVGSGGGDNVRTAGSIVGVKRAGRIVMLVAPVAPSTVRDARVKRDALAAAMYGGLARQTVDLLASAPLPAPSIRITPDSMDTLPPGPEDFGGTDEGSHYMAQTSAAKLRETPS